MLFITTIILTHDNDQFVNKYKVDRTKTIGTGTSDYNPLKNTGL